MRAILFAAGLGTRLRPLTDQMPKALVPVGGQPLLYHTSQRLRDCGVTETVINIHHHGQQIIDYLATHDLGMTIHVSDERDKLLDTGGGLKRALHLLPADSPVLVHNVDILSNADLGAFYNEGKTADVALLVSPRQTQRYLLFDDTMRLVGWTNLATGEVRSPYPNLDVSRCHRYAFSGIHIVSPHIRTAMEEWPDVFPVMDFYLRTCDRLQIKGIVKDDLQLLDVGKQDTLATAEAFLKKWHS